MEVLWGGVGSLPPMLCSQYWICPGSNGGGRETWKTASQCGSFHRPASMIYQLAGNEKKFPAIKGLILLKQEAVPCHRVLLRETGSSCH